MHANEWMDQWFAHSHDITCACTRNAFTQNRPIPGNHCWHLKMYAENKNIVCVSITHLFIASYRIRNELHLFHNSHAHRPIDSTHIRVYVSVERFTYIYCFVYATRIYTRCESSICWEYGKFRFTMKNEHRRVNTHTRARTPTTLTQNNKHSKRTSSLPLTSSSCSLICLDLIGLRSAQCAIENHFHIRLIWNS